MVRKTRKIYLQRSDGVVQSYNVSVKGFFQKYSFKRKVGLRRIFSKRIKPLSIPKEPVAEPPQVALVEFWWVSNGIQTSPISQMRVNVINSKNEADFRRKAISKVNKALQRISGNHITGNIFHIQDAPLSKYRYNEDLVRI